MKRLLLAGAALVLAAPAPPGFRLTDVTARSGLDFVHGSGARERKDYIFEAKGGGAAAVDVDNDGWLDVVFAQGSTLAQHRAGASPGPVIYRNRGGMRFENVTARAGLEARGWGMGVAAADFDNDGFVDLLLTNLGPDVLYRNDGDGTFSDVTARSGVSVPGWSSSAAFCRSRERSATDRMMRRRLAAAAGTSAGRRRVRTETDPGGLQAWGSCLRRRARSVTTGSGSASSSRRNSTAWVTACWIAPARSPAAARVSMRRTAMPAS